MPAFSPRTWLRPVITPFGGYGLSGGRANFDLIDVVMRSPADGYVATRMSCDQLLASADDRNRASAALNCIGAARPDFAGLQMDCVHLM